MANTIKSCETYSFYGNVNIKWSRLSNSSNLTAKKGLNVVKKSPLSLARSVHGGKSWRSILQVTCLRTGNQLERETVQIKLVNGISFTTDYTNENNRKDNSQEDRQTVVVNCNERRQNRDKSKLLLCRGRGEIAVRCAGDSFANNVSSSAIWRVRAV